MYRQAKNSAAAAGFSSVSKWVKADGEKLPSALGKYARALVHQEHKLSRPTSDCAKAAAHIAQCLGKNQEEVAASAAAAAHQDGFCLTNVCTEHEIEKWAHAQGVELSGTMGAYAAALACKTLSSRSAADTVAKALKKDAKVVLEHAGTTTPRKPSLSSCSAPC